MLHVGTAKLARGRGVVEERRDLGWDLGYDVFWNVDGEIGEMLVGQVGDQVRELSEAVQTRSSILLLEFVSLGYVEPNLQELIALCDFGIGGFSQTVKRLSQSVTVLVEIVDGRAHFIHRALELLFLNERVHLEFLLFLLET